MKNNQSCEAQSSVSDFFFRSKRYDFIFVIYIRINVFMVPFASLVVRSCLFWHCAPHFRQGEPPKRLASRDHNRQKQRQAWHDEWWVLLHNSTWDSLHCSIVLKLTNKDAYRSIWTYPTTIGLALWAPNIEERWCHSPFRCTHSGGRTGEYGDTPYSQTSSPRVYNGCTARLHGGPRKLHSQ